MDEVCNLKGSITTLSNAIADHLKTPDEYRVSTCLDEINNVLKPGRIRNEILVKEDAVHLIEMCQKLSPGDNKLVEKCCKLLVNVLPKLSVDNENILKLTISWILASISNWKTLHEFEQIDDILHFYASVIKLYDKLKINDLKTEAVISGLLLPPLCKNNDAHIENQKIVYFHIYIKFLEAATVIILKDKQYFSFIGCSMIKLMEEMIVQKNIEPRCIEILKYALLILLQLIDQSKQWTCFNFNKLLPIVLACLRYGLILNESKFPNDLQPSPIVEWEENLSTGNVVSTANMTNKRRQTKKKITESKNKIPRLVTFSIDDEILINVRDSNSSEDESCKSNVIGRMIIEVRLLAAQTMKKIFTIIEKKVLLGYLYLILDGPLNIQNCLISEVTNSIRDPSSEVRATVITAFTSLFNGSKLYFAQAQYREKKGAFNTWSETLADYIIAIHNTLLKDFSMETYRVRLVLLHCLSTMIINTPYTRLIKNLLKSVLDTILVYTKCEPCENHLRIGAFRCLISVFNSELPNDEKELLIGKKTDIINLCLYLFKETKLSLENDQDNSQVIVRRLCWQMLNSYCNHYHGLIENRMLLNIAVEDMKYTKQNLLRKNILLCLKQMSTVSEGNNYKSAKLEKWKLVFRKLIPQMFAEKDPQILPILIESISTLGSNVFSELEDELTITCCDELHTFVTSTDHNIQSAALSTLGIFIKYEKLSKNPSYIKNTVDVLLYVSSVKKVNSVQEKLVWALNCLSELLVENWDLYDLENSKLLCLIKVALSTLDDHKLCRAYGIRALGLFLSLIDRTDITEQEFIPLFKNSVEILIDIATKNNIMKNRWNSCHSLGILYQTNSIKKLPPFFKSVVLNTLTALMKNCSNFKVRLVACSSLIYKRQDLYDNYYNWMWNGLFDAFENSKNLPNVREYKHQQKLINQLCVLFCNLCCLLKSTDINSLIFLFESRLHSIQDDLEKFFNSTDVLNSEILAATHNHLANMLSTQSLTTKQTETVKSLLNMFSNH